jgi:plastocyanin
MRTRTESLIRRHSANRPLGWAGRVSFELLLALTILIVSASGCTGDQEAATQKQPAGSRTEQVPYDASAPSGTLTGRATFSGTPPTPRRVRMDADPYCARANPEGAERISAVVGPAGELAEVLVFVRSGLPDVRFETPQKPAVLDQLRCNYHPRVVGVQVGQPIEILNSDATLHNVHSMPVESKGFNIGMPSRGMSAVRKFSEQEVFVRFKCDVHPWMEAYVGVIATPFFAVTGPDGTFRIEGIPPGEYVVEAAHPSLGSQTETVAIRVGEESSAWFNFSD